MEEIYGVFNNTCHNISSANKTLRKVAGSPGSGGFGKEPTNAGAFRH